MGDTSQNTLPENPGTIAMEALKFYAEAKTWNHKGRAMVKVQHGRNFVKQPDLGAVARQALQRIGQSITAVKAAVEADRKRPKLIVPDDTGLKQSPGGVLVAG